MTDLVCLSATELSAALSAGKATSEQIVRACLARIEAREAVVGAWQYLDPDAALAEARRRDREPRRGALHGIPLGVKDIMDTADMPTEYGSEIYLGHRPDADADCVAAARTAGAVVLGKTVTTEFAAYRPAKTANPHHPGHTPGGSSSGSAAAVADLMVPLAFGSQTVGSVIRPASFCGVVGFKASYGRFGLGGVKELAGGLDTLGFFARTVEDIALVTAVMAGRTPPRWPDDAQSPCRVGLCRTPQWPDARPETKDAVEDAAARLARGGYEVSEVRLPEAFDGLAGDHHAIFVYQAVRALAAEWHDHRERLGAKLQALLAEGETCSEERYRAAEVSARRCRSALDDIFSSHNLLIAPSAPGEAPAGLEATGDPLFNRIWTLLHVPCLTLPGYRGPNGLPVGVQVIGKRDEDDLMLARAAALARHLPDEGRAAPPAG
jgi:Asp-tRNA(Asn)/Glu-tRNA(Gln) amidotransferase A subunit family amidase